ncbi:MAG: Heterodisulfide reductase subunit [Actinomycetota bacterium]|nr:Heterodisulfide reductase subunit [Actinomycetota bacterium]
MNGDPAAEGTLAPSDPYLPELMEVVSVTQQTSDVKSVRARFLDPDRQRDFRFRVGQFGIWSRFGAGESVFNLCGSSTWHDRLEFCFRRVGKVTDAFWGVQPGEVIGFRGPYGNSYPVQEWEGRDLVFVAGGIAMPPVRCAIWYCLEHRERFGEITVVYGARSVADLVFADELDQWAAHPRTRVVKTVDPGGRTPDWDGLEGFVPTVLAEAGVGGADTSALVVGPPVMIKYSLPVLMEAGLAPNRIHSSLENRMKCGIGRCGRCNVGGTYLCKQGPVYSFEEIMAMPADM